MIFHTLFLILTTKSKLIINNLHAFLNEVKHLLFWRTCCGAIGIKVLIEKIQVMHIFYVYISLYIN